MAQIAGLVAIVALIAALIVFGYRIWFLSRALEAEGEVVKYAEHDSGSDGEGGRPLFGSVYACVIDFRDYRGRLCRFESGIQSATARHYLGQVVRVVYDPSRPERAYVKEPVELWALPVFLTVLGGYSLWQYMSA